MKIQGVTVRGSSRHAGFDSPAPTMPPGDATRILWVKPPQGIARWKHRSGAIPAACTPSTAWRKRTKNNKQYDGKQQTKRNQCRRSGKAGAWRGNPQAHGGRTGEVGQQPDRAEAERGRRIPVLLHERPNRDGASQAPDGGQGYPDCRNDHQQEPEDSPMQPRIVAGRGDAGLHPRIPPGGRAGVLLLRPLRAGRAIPS